MLVEMSFFHIFCIFLQYVDAEMKISEAKKIKMISYYAGRVVDFKCFFLFPTNILTTKLFVSENMFSPVF